MRKVLIVDDAVFMQKATSAMLSRKYETICASSGEEALELYEKEKPDMILTDLIMPHMTGLELQKALFEKYNEHIPIMFMTADESEENESLGLEGGAMDYIRKPFKEELLLRRVDNIMRHVDRIQGLKTVAETDPMTGLLNKAYAQKALGETCAKASGVLMMIDLDSFKLVNDLYGHGMGDKVLIRFAEIIRGAIRSTDVAGRMGGDEFIAFCRDVRDEALISEKSRQINEQLVAAAKELMGEDMGIPLGASIGAVLVPDEGTEFAELYKKADKALYRVKQNGKHGCAVYRGDSAVSAREEETEPASTLDTVRKILGERNRQKGAYELSLDGFQSVYRYLLRSIENYHRTAELAVFTLSRTGEGAADAADAFGEVLGASLRRSDAYAKNGKNQYLVLLAEQDSESAEPIFRRVLENWSLEEGSRFAAASYESETLRG